MRNFMYSPSVIDEETANRGFGKSLPPIKPTVRPEQAQQPDKWRKFAGALGEAMLDPDRGYHDVMKSRRQSTATMDFLRQSGANENELTAAQQSPDVLQALMKEAFARRSQRQQAAKPETFGKNPVWGTVDGKRVLGVVGSGGTFKQLDTGNFEPQQRIQKQDMGNEVIWTDSYTGEILKRETKSLRRAEQEKAIGKKSGETAATLPGQSLVLQDNIKKIDEIINHPGLESSVGTIEGRLPGVVNSLRTGGASDDFYSRVDQLKNKAFMAAREELKGGGQITDFEGQKAEQALNRASYATNEADFKAAMLDFKEALMRGYALLQSKAGQGSQTAAPAAQPAPAQAPRRRVYNPATGRLE